MANKGYKKYMKKNTPKEHSLWKLFAVSFFGMLLVFTFLIKSFSPTVDVSIGDYKQEESFDNSDEIKKIVDQRLAMIQEEDQGLNFSEIMNKNEEKENAKQEEKLASLTSDKTLEVVTLQKTEPVYKVFIGSYTSAEQAKVAKDIIIESGSTLSPIVKCLGSNNYTLQVGIFKNKASADALLVNIQKSHLPGRIVQEY